ncbi:MAG TPA: DUF2157 domain-containing protein, partial [Pseudonocardia sp.]|nr:DUF2157 domain-containing protein [Pseudonocardia sp.]
MGQAPDPGTASAPDAVWGALDRAVAAGIVSAEQAAAVVALAAQTPAVRAQERGAGRRTVLAEVLGYVGGALAVVAGLLLGAQLWAELGAGVRVALLAAVAAACLAAGAALARRDGAAGRLGSFLWAAAVLATGATVAVGVADLGGAAEETALLAAAGVAVVLAAALWWRRPEVLQQVATFAAAVFALVAVLDVADEAGNALLRHAGPLVWLLGVAWIAAAAPST